VAGSGCASDRRVRTARGGPPGCADGPRSGERYVRDGLQRPRDVEVRRPRPVGKVVPILLIGRRPPAACSQPGRTPAELEAGCQPSSKDVDASRRSIPISDVALFGILKRKTAVFLEVCLGAEIGTLRLVTGFV